MDNKVYRHREDVHPVYSNGERIAKEADYPTTELQQKAIGQYNRSFAPCKVVLCVYLSLDSFRSTVPYGSESGSVESAQNERPKKVLKNKENQPEPVDSGWFLECKTN